jgi:hypothetical protein
VARAHGRAAMAAALLLAFGAVRAEGPASLVAGWMERARLMPGEIAVQAKLDTGADHSSLHATGIARFQRDGAEWIAFDVIDDSGATLRLERPLVRTARVSSVLTSRSARPVVRLGVCVGPVYRVVEVNLVDRAGMNERMLIGRSFLEGRLLVDPSRRHLLEPSCAGGAAP